MPEVGQKIEFLSDAMTDKGPATGSVSRVKPTVDGYYITVDFGDSQESFSWDDMREQGADVRGDLWLIKAHVRGHMRGSDYVCPYERGTGGHPPTPAHHPQRNDDGKPVLITHPSHPSAPSTWDIPDAVATFVPGGDCPARLNGVSFTAWRDHPTTAEGWDYVDGVDDDLAEPPFQVKPGKSIGAGVVIEEPDGRVWLCAPSNQFGGYRATWPKGTVEDGMSFQASAIREAFEETGLKVKITGHLGDFERTTSVARMYRAVRVGGTPVACGWESQAVHLVPRSMLYEHLNGSADHPIAEKIGAGPAPKQPEKQKSSLF
jgi:8-oxo-dGTP pyrophosphatase MutT (NUDIX family)